MCDRIAIVDAGRIVACDSPANLLATIGETVVEIRADDAQAAVRVLIAWGRGPRDALAIGSTLTIAQRAASATRITDLLHEARIAVHAITTRRATLDDVYLRLTGDRIAGTEN